MLKDFHVPILKPQSAWSDLLNFWSFKGFSVHPRERLWRPISRLKFYPTLKIKLTTTNKPCTKQTPRPVIISLFNSLKRFLWLLSLNPASGETLTTPPLHSLIKHAKTNQFQNVFLKKWGSLFQPNQHNWKVGTIGNVITEKNLAASTWWNIYNSVNLPNFDDHQVLPRFLEICQHEAWCQIPS